MHFVPNQSISIVLAGKPIDLPVFVLPEAVMQI
jgi:hypothetical protein